MHPNEARALSAEEIKNHVRNSREELVQLRFKRGTNQLSNSSLIKKAKRNVARLLTIERERELGIDENATVAVGEAPKAKVESKPARKTAKSSRAQKKAAKVVNKRKAAKKAPAKKTKSNKQKSSKKK